MLRILTVDDHAIVRQGVRIVFEGRVAEFVFGEAHNVEEAARMVREQEWDIVVMDITLGDRSGIEVMKELKLMRPKLPSLSSACTLRHSMRGVLFARVQTGTSRKTVLTMNLRKL